MRLVLGLLLFGSCAAGLRHAPVVELSVGSSFAGTCLLDINSADTYLIGAQAAAADDNLTRYDPHLSLNAVAADQNVSAAFVLSMRRPFVRAAGRVFVDDALLYDRHGRAAVVLVSKLEGVFGHVGQLSANTSGLLGANLNHRADTNATDLLFDGRKRIISYEVYAADDDNSSTLTLGTCHSSSPLEPVVLPLQPHPNGWWKVQADALSVGNETAMRRVPVLFSTTLPEIALPKAAFEAYTSDVKLTLGAHGFQVACDAEIDNITLTFADQNISIQARAVLEPTGSEAVCLLRVNPSPQGHVVLGLPFYQAASACWDAERKQVTLTQLTNGTVVEEAAEAAALSPKFVHKAINVLTIKTQLNANETVF